MKHLFPLLIALHSLFISCQETKTEKATQADSIAESPIEILPKAKEELPVLTERTDTIITDTIIIDKIHHAEILHLLTQLPDNSRESWEWKHEDRLDMVTTALNDGYIVDTDAQYMNIHALEPHYFMMQVVDGSWSVAIFDIDNTNKLIITNDHVGDGDVMHTYTWNGSDINELAINDVLPDIKTAFIKKSELNCESIIEDEFLLILDIDFSQKNKIIVTNSSKSYDSNCLNGNRLELIFNKNKQRFEVSSIQWQ